MTLKRSFIGWAAMVAGAGVLAACGGGSPTSSPFASPAASSSASAAGQAGGQSAPDTLPPHPCTLVTKDEATAILGGPVQDPVEDTTPGVTKCTYTSASDSTNVADFRFDPDDASGSGYNLALKGLEGKTSPVSGVGDAAFCAPDLGGYSQFHALSKAKALDVIVNTPQSNSCDQAKAFALKVLSRL